MGVIEDTHMPSSGFSNLAMAFYASFLVFEPIQSSLIQKFPTAKFLGINGQFATSIIFGLLIRSVTLWGIVVTMNCVCHSYPPLVALRVLLGIFESCAAPRYVSNPSLSVEEAQDCRQHVLTRWPVL